MRISRGFASRVLPYREQAERGLNILVVIHCALLASSCLAPTSPTEARLQEEKRKKAELENLTTSTDAALHSMRFESIPNSTAESCVAWTAPVQVKLLASDGTSVATSTTRVTLEAFSDSTCSSIVSPPLTAAALTVSSENGMAEFEQVTLKGAPRDIYLRARNETGDIKTPCSGPISLTPGSAAKVTFALAPSATGISTVALGTQPRAQLSDACGNPLTLENVSITLGAYSNSACTSPATAGTLSVDIATVSTSGGAASFSGVALNSGGTHYLGASAPGFASTCSEVILSNPVPASSIAFQTAGSSSTDSCMPLTTAPSVKVLNSIGAVDTTSNLEITLESFSDSSCSVPSLATLSADQLSLAATAGVATFSNVKLTGAIESVYLRARNSNGTLQTLCTGPVTVSRGAGLLAFSSGPSPNATAGLYLGTQPRVGFLDQCLNPILNETESAQLEIYEDSACTTASSAGTMTAQSLTGNPSAGIAGFSDVKLLRSGVKYLGATASSCQKAFSNAGAQARSDNSAMDRISTTVTPSASIWAVQLQSTMHSSSGVAAPFSVPPELHRA